MQPARRPGAQAATWCSGAARSALQGAPLPTAPPADHDESFKSLPSAADTSGVGRTRIDDDYRGTDEHEPDRRQRIVPTPLPPPVQPATHAELVLVATRLAALEEQFTSYFAAMAAQANAARLAAETARNEGRADLERHAAQLREMLDKITEHHESEQRSLRMALDQRLADFGSHQDWRVTELEARLERVADETTLGLDARVESAVQTVQLKLDQALSALSSRLTEAESAVGRADEHHRALKRRLDEHEIALGGRIEEAVANLIVRMDERNMALTKRIEDNTAALQQQLQHVGESFARQLEQLTERYDDRLLALEQRVGDEIGNRVAALEATIGRVSNSVDEAMVSLSHRLADLEARSIEADERLATMAAVVAKIDEEAIEELKERLSNAVGEATLVRIEMDRLSEGLDERFDRVQVRLADMEAKVSDAMDVSTAIQLERLEELERAVAELDPAELVRRSELGLSTTGFPPPPPNGRQLADDRSMQPTPSESTNGYYSTDGAISFTSW